MTGGLVVAANQHAADAGAAALAAGGSAMDGAVAAALALSVVEPAQCGLGGYGGFLTYWPAGGGPFQVAFNTHVPARLRDTAAGGPTGGNTALPDGGSAVAPPAVVAGLLAAHGAAGRRPLAELLAPAVKLARDGFVVGNALARAFADHFARTGGGSPEFARVFFPDGTPPPAGALLRQPDLARTLERLDGDLLRRGPLVEAVCETVVADGGFLAPSDFGDVEPTVGPAAGQEFGAAQVFGPAPEVCGAGVLFPALAGIDVDRLGVNRSAGYVAELGRALREAWARRARATVGDVRATHTTHVCAADAEGALASLTFTHGRRKFGSGLVARGTGVVLNAGVGLYAPSPEGARAVTNMAPVVWQTADGARHALGAVGGPRISGIVLTAIVDVAVYGASLAEAIAAPHLAVRPADGRIEAERELLESAAEGHGWSALAPGEAFGPACGITRTAGGAVVPGPDPRFEIGVSRTQPVSDTPSR